MFRKCLLVCSEKKQYPYPNHTLSSLVAVSVIRFTHFYRTNTYYLDFFHGSSLYPARTISAEYGELDHLQVSTRNAKIVSLRNFAISVIGLTLVFRSLLRASNRRFSHK